VDAPSVFFFIFAGIALVSALTVILKSNPVSSAFSLVLTFFAFAGIYAVMEAHLIAAIQILVYTGAIMVLFVFVIMLLNADELSSDLDKTSTPTKIFIVGLVGTLVVAFGWIFKNSPITIEPGPFSLEAIKEAGGNTRVVSEIMFSKFILPFELTSILLVAVIVGVVAIAMRKQRG